jgi:flagellar biosynthetic protein FliQ
VGDWALLTLFQKAMVLLAVMATVPLVVAMVVGVAIGVLQAATSVQEATLSFLPKFLAVMTVMALLGPLMARLLVAFTSSLFNLIPQIAR